MADIITLLVDPQVEIVVIPLPVPTVNDLEYTLGGGTLFPNLVNDLVSGGNQWHGGNTLIDTTYTIKDCNDLSITSDSIQVNSPIITKGLFQKQGITNNYLWDEVYTTPLGVYTAETSGSTLADYQFYLTNDNTNELFISINDVNILPKVGDYLFLQIVPTGMVIGNTIYTDGVNSLPVVPNSEVYTFYVNQVNIQSTTPAFNIYKLTLDKSISIQTTKKYILVLLNRKDTGIQKELFYDTFEQIEVFREQILGDPYDNTSITTVPLGRKNYLNYTSAQYLGLSVLLNSIINSSSTPFIVYDLTDEIKDRILPQPNTFSFVLPFVMVQGDTRTGSALNNPQTLVNSGSLLNDPIGVGRYTGLYFNWDSGLTNRVGWVFYELRIIVIDDPELALSLAYNSNRNYTLPRASITGGFGNDIANVSGGLDLQVTNVSNGSPVVVTTALPHNLTQGTPIFISGVNVKDSIGNVISASANGSWYVKFLTPNDPFSFALFDVTLTVPVTGNGEFYTNTNGSSGEVKGTLPAFNYFYTYRLIGKHYSSMLPYAQTTNFNFALNGKINDSSAGQLLLTLPNLQWLQDATNTVGFEATDLEIIIGKYVNGDSSNPQLITDIENVVSIPIGSLTFVRSLFDMSSNQEDFSTPTNGIVVTKQDYTDAVTANTFYNLIDSDPLYVYSNGDPMPVTLLTGNSIWTLGNINFQSESDIFRSTIQVVVPAGNFNDTLNPSYDPLNPFISDRFISEVAVVLTDVNTGKDLPIIYTKIAPCVRKSNSLDLIFNLRLDF